MRTSEASPLGVEYFTWNTLSSVPQLLMDGSNAYIYGPQGTALGTAPVEQISLSAPNSQSSVTYLLSDPQGVRLTFNSTSTITADASYDAYGNVTSGGLSNVTPFGYAGGYTDPTGLIYLINRYYDPSTGQFLSVDPLVGITDQPYQYVGGDPINGSDPSGLTTEGLCLSSQLYIGDQGGNVQVCIVEANGNQQVGMTVTGGSYITASGNPIERISGFISDILHLFAASASATYQRTTANSIKQLGGLFTYESGTALVFTGSYLQNSSGNVRGVDLGGTIGFPPVNAEVGTTCTITKMFAASSLYYTSIVNTINQFTQNPASYSLRVLAQALLTGPIPIIS